ncbi:MAG: GNAT family N-acetyltransferase [Bacteroidetes bacterium]|nr:MAG: GNAT family N-acetyltransferase [Bacteroidota bacterium]
MIFREAQLSDIPRLYTLRISVKENRLSNLFLITVKDYENFLMYRGKGWVCEKDDQIRGFSIVDMEKNNVWALFVQPEFEGRGIGQKLLHMLLESYFEQKQENIWLSTGPKTRAEEFYRKFGWEQVGRLPNGETRFELSVGDWTKLNRTGVNE